MASPFSVFRRNQKVLLAVSTVMIMLLFVIGDPLMKYIKPGRGGQNPVVIKTKSRNYYQSDLYMLVQSRKVVENFLQALAIQWAQKVAMSGQVSPLDLNNFPLAKYEQWQRQLMFRLVPPEDLPPSDDSDQARQRAQEEAQAIQTVLLADRAEAQGILVSDRTINDYLKSLTNNSITSEELQRIVSTLRGEAGGVTQAYFFEALRRELLAALYNQMFMVAIQPLPPATRWDYFQRLNRRATAEVLGVSVEKLLTDVPEPKESELVAFFDAHDKTIQVPDSPEPGFKQPTKAVFQYFKAKYADFLARAEKDITTEEMKDYYERQKDIRFREREKPADDGADKSPAADSDAAPATDAPAAAKPDATPAADSDKPAAPSDKSPPATDADKKKSSGTRLASPFRPVALAQKAADAPAAESSTAQPATPATAAADGKDASADQPADGSESDADGATDEKEKAKTELKYEPFEKVEEEVRTAVAETKVDSLVTAAFDRIKVKMREYASARGLWEANHEEDSSLEKPEPLDLPALASAENLEVHQTDLISARELESKYDLGKSFTPVRMPQGLGRMPFVNTAFNERLFVPMRSQDDEAGDSYLTWKIQETPSEVPSLDEVRQEVVRAFKMIEARKLATAAADQLAKEAREAKKPLSEAFAGRDGIDVVDTGAFTWMTPGAIPFDPSANLPRLSAVHGVEAPGEDFMRAVFNASPDQIGVVFNQPQTIAYVVQVREFQPDRTELEKQFVVEDLGKYGQLASGDWYQIHVDWLRWIDRQAGLSWVAPESAPTGATR